jgi:MFS transporter, DHA3 family, macrolide efflux protein
MLRSELLSIPAFRNLWLGQAISQLGDAFYYVSFMFMVKKLTGSNAMVGYVGAAEVLPFLLFMPFAGVLADRVDRRKLMLWSDIVSGFVLLLLAAVTLLNGTPPIWMIFTTAIMLSSARSFFLPTKNTSIPALVPENKLKEAFSLSMATENFMRLGGTALTAGGLAALFEFAPQWFFLGAILVNCSSFLLSAVFIAKLPAILPKRDPDQAPQHPGREFTDGIRLILQRRVLTVIVVTSMFFSLMVSPFFVVYVAANEKWFGGKPGPLAWFEFAFFLGMIAGSFIVAKANIRSPGIAFAFSLAIVGATIAAMGVSPWFWAFAFWNVAAGLAVPFADIPVKTYVQLTVSDAYRGRVNSSMMMLSTCAMPIGMACAGMLLDRIGVEVMFLAMGVGMTLVGMTALLSRPFRESALPVPGETEELEAIPATSAA